MRGTHECGQPAARRLSKKLDQPDSAEVRTYDLDDPRAATSTPGSVMISLMKVRPMSISPFASSAPYRPCKRRHRLLKMAYS
jgi:hypothetical protein